MKKSRIVLTTTFFILAVILFFILSHFMIASPINQFKESIPILYERQQTIENNFEQVYSQKDYTISTYEDKIVVRLNEKNATLLCYFTKDKHFINSEIKGIPLCTEKSAFVFGFLLVIVLSIVLSFIIIGIFVGIINVIQNTVRKLKN